MEESDSSLKIWTVIRVLLVELTRSEISESSTDDEELSLLSISLNGSSIFILSISIVSSGRELPA